jgi:hypothetical protein
MVLLEGVHIGTLYNLMRITVIYRCSSSIVLDIGAEEEKNPIVFGENTMMWS